MRKTASFGIVSVIATGIAAAIIVPGIAQSGAQSQRITARNNAPLKAAPNPQAAILATVPRGSTLSLEYCNADQWCRVQFGRRTGWMAAVNLNLPAGTETARLTGQARLRAGPGTQYQALATLQAGTRVSVIRCQPQWCNVAAGYRRGWVASRLIDRGGDWNNPRPPVPGPGPGRRSELQMFTGRNCQGNTYSTLEAVPNLNYPVRSARVIGGTGDVSRDGWQLCVGTNYNGVCTSTTPRCSNLDELGGRALRSVRPAFGEGSATGPAICTREYAPVCARSGRRDRTFSNACMAKAEGYTVRYQGQCR